MITTNTITSDITWVETSQDQCIIFELDAEAVPYANQSITHPHRHSYQEIIWIRKGLAEHLLDDNVVQIPSGTLLIVPMGRIHRFIPSYDCSASVIRFKEEFLPNSSYLLFCQFIEHTALQLTPEQSVCMEAYFSLIRSEYHEADPYHLQPLRHLLSALIAKLEEFSLQHSRVQPHDYARTLCIWNRFNDLIEKKFKAEHKVSYYVSELGVSSRKLGEIVKLYTGKNVAEVIDERLIQEAKRFILFSDLSIKEIAFDLGYSEHSYFSKVFKRLTRMTPSEFKSRAVTA